MNNNNTSSAGRQEKEYIQSEVRAAELEKQCEEQTKAKVTRCICSFAIAKGTNPAKPYPFDALGTIAGAAAREFTKLCKHPMPHAVKAFLRRFH